MYLNLVKLTVILIDSCLMVLGSQFLLLVGWWYSWHRRFLVTKVHKVFDFRFLLGRAGSNNPLQFVDWWGISSGTIQELNGILGVNCSSFWNYSFSYGRMDKSYSFFVVFLSWGIANFCSYFFFFFSVGQIDKVFRQAIKVRYPMMIFLVDKEYTVLVNKYDFASWHKMK